MAGANSRQLLHRIALLAFVAVLATGIALRDVEAIAFAVAILVGVFLLPLRKGLLGRIVLALVFADMAFWMVPAAVSNARHGGEVAYLAVPIGFAAIAVAGLFAAVGVGSRLVPVTVLGLAAVLVFVSGIRANPGLVSKENDARMSTKNVKFSPESLRVGEGEIGVVVKNKDLFWHTFTIDELDVDLYVPVGATRRVTFKAPPGTYDFYCAIPGHDAAGMDGQMVVISSSPSA